MSGAMPSTPLTPQPDGTVLVTQYDQPDLTIKPYPLSPTALLQPVALHEEARQTLAALLTTLLGSAAQSGIGTSYVLCFAPHVTDQLADSRTAMMPVVDGGMRAAAVDGQGEISGQTTLVGLPAISPTLATLGIWQTLAVATARYYLSGIEPLLTRMAGAIATLRCWHENREIGRIENAHGYLLRTRDLLLADPINNGERGAVIAQLDQIAREAALVVDTRHQSLAQAETRIRSLSFSSPTRLTLEPDADQLVKLLHAAAADLQILTLELGLQYAVTQMRHALLRSGHQITERLRAVPEAACLLYNQWQALAATTREQIGELAAHGAEKPALRNLQSLATLELDTVTQRIIPELQALETAGRQTRRPADALQLVLQLRPDGSLATWVHETTAATPNPAPYPDLATLTAIHHLRGVEGAMPAGWDNLPQADEQFRLKDGTSLRTFTSPSGFLHVFLADPAGTCLFGVAAPAPAAPRLEQAVADLYTSTRRA
jgi:hypothetical protein